MQTAPIEMKTSASDAAEAEQLFFTQTDGEDETNEMIFERKQLSQKNVTEWVANEETITMKPSIKEFPMINENGNQGESILKGGARRLSGTEDFKTLDTWPARWWSANDNRQPI